ncbi:T9SS type A sorting domain-containing protein, partial [Spirosoma sp.]|uniref:T9SS type A sorting domain-containing protein n=1 Tax=Spirosoma sp. TaxID=1899569 RepID=UPI003B3B4B0C
QVDLDGRISYSRIISVRHEQRQTLSMVVYPNPTTEQLRLRLSSNQQVGRAQVYTINGVRVMNEEGTEKLDVRALPTGVYVVEVTTATGEVLRQRFIKR